MRSKKYMWTVCEYYTPIQNQPKSSHHHNISSNVLRIVAYVEIVERERERDVHNLQKSKACGDLNLTNESIAIKRK